MEKQIIELLSYYTEELRLNQDNEEAKLWLKMIVSDLCSLLNGDNLVVEFIEEEDSDET